MPPVGTIGDREGTAAEGAAMEGSATTRADSTFSNRPTFMLLKGGISPIDKEVCGTKTEVKVTDGTAALCPKPRPFRTAGISL